MKFPIFHRQFTLVSSALLCVGLILDACSTAAPTVLPCNMHGKEYVMLYSESFREELPKDWLFKGDWSVIETDNYSALLIEGEGDAVYEPGVWGEQPFIYSFKIIKLVGKFNADFLNSAKKGDYPRYSLEISEDELGNDTARVVNLTLYKFSSASTPQILDSIRKLEYKASKKYQIDIDYDQGEIRVYYYSDEPSTNQPKKPVLMATDRSPLPSGRIRYVTQKDTTLILDDIRVCGQPFVLSGTVVNLSGTPVPGIRVSVYGSDKSYGEDTSGKKELNSGKTDQEGNFKIEVQPGYDFYLLNVKDQSSYKADKAETNYGKIFDDTWIEHESPLDKGASFQDIFFVEEIPTETPIPTTLPPIYSFYGKVWNETNGSPANELEVSLYAAENPYPESGKWLTSVKTDSDGYYEVKADAGYPYYYLKVPPGYEVKNDSPSGVVQQDYRIEYLAPPSEGHDYSDSLTIWEISPTIESVPELPIYSLAGQVLNEEDKTPVIGVLVTLYGSYNEFPDQGTVLNSTYTNDKGEYILTTSEAFTIYSVSVTNLPDKEVVYAESNTGRVREDYRVEYIDIVGASANYQTWFYMQAPLTDTPVPVPTDTPMPIPTDTPMPIPTDTPMPIPTDTPVPVPTDTPVPVPTDTPVPIPTDTPMSIPTDTPVPVPTDKSVPVPTDTSMPISTDTPLPVTANTSTPEPTSADVVIIVPSLTPITPTPTPTRKTTLIPNIPLWIPIFLGLVFLVVVGTGALGLVAYLLFRGNPTGSAGQPPERPPRRPTPLSPILPPLRLLDLWLSKGGSGKGRVLKRGSRLTAGREYSLHVQLKLRGESRRRPEEQTRENISLNVVLFAPQADFTIPERTGQLNLPVYDSSEVLIRTVLPQHSGRLQVRVCVYYGNLLLQSAVLEAPVGRRDLGRITRRIDYIASGTFSRLELLAQPSLSLFTNQAPDGTHWLGIFSTNVPSDSVLRQGDLQHFTPGYLSSRAELARKSLSRIQGKGLYRLKNNLPLDERAMDVHTQDLVDLAQQGTLLYNDLFGSDPEGSRGRERVIALRDLLQQPGLVSIARCRRDSVSMPWGMLYSLPLRVESDIPLQVCPIYLEQLRENEWFSGQDELSHQCDLLDDPLNCLAQNGCPRKGSESYQTVCPFGFIGLAHQIEQPIQLIEPFPTDQTPSKIVQQRLDTNTRILHKAGEAVRVGLGAYAGFSALPLHRQALQDLSPIINLEYAEDREQVWYLFQKGGQHIFYFFCHGVVDKDNTFQLMVGQPDKPGFISASSLTPPIIQWPAEPHPLVVLNGCETAALKAELMGVFMNNLRFIGALGVVGTEIKVMPELAMAFGLPWMRLLICGQPAGQAMLKVRRHLERQGNPLGLAYSLYAPAGLHLHEESGCASCLVLEAQSSTLLS